MCVAIHSSLTPPFQRKRQRRRPNVAARKVVGLRRPPESLLCAEHIGREDNSAQRPPISTSKSLELLACSGELRLAQPSHLEAPFPSPSKGANTFCRPLGLSCRGRVLHCKGSRAFRRPWRRRKDAPTSASMRPCGLADLQELQHQQQSAQGKRPHKANSWPPQRPRHRGAFVRWRPTVGSQPARRRPQRSVQPRASGANGRSRWQRRQRGVASGRATAASGAARRLADRLAGLAATKRARYCTGKLAKLSLALVRSGSQHKLHKLHWAHWAQCWPAAGKAPAEDTASAAFAARSPLAG